MRGLGFARKQGADFDALVERMATAKGEYRGVRKHRAARRPGCAARSARRGLLRGLTFPEADALGR